MDKVKFPRTGNSQKPDQKPERSEANQASAGTQGGLGERHASGWRGKAAGKWQEGGFGNGK